MDNGDTAGQSVEQVECLKGIEPFPGLAQQEPTQQFTFDIVRHQKGERFAAENDFFLRVVLDQDRTMAKFVQFLGVEVDRTIARVSQREEKLRRPFYPGCNLANLIDLSFPPCTQERQHLVFPGQDATRIEAK